MRIATTTMERLIAGIYMFIREIRRKYSPAEVLERNFRRNSRYKHRSSHVFAVTKLGGVELGGVVGTIYGKFKNGKM